ncbi:MAG TPA: plastocyanin/azurin family copper-binding protein [Actinomycetota bacterium]|nr:plastocyanin/azurin family copper-binding protein [Actinomycetota bacterium]
MRRVRVAIAIALAVVPAAAWLAFAPPAPAAERSVRVVTGNRFDPKDKFVVAGDTVVWTYDDANGAPHTVTRETTPERFDSSPSNCPRTNPLEPDDCLDSNNRTYSHRFDRPGTYSYFCKVHGQSMSGTIHVAPRETAAPSPSPTRTPASPSPSPSGSPSGSGSPDPSASPTGTSTASPSPEDTLTPTPSDTGTPAPSPGGGSGTKVALAVVALGSLGGAGFLVYRRFLS